MDAEIACRAKGEVWQRGASVVPRCVPRQEQAADEIHEYIVVQHPQFRPLCSYSDIPYAVALLRFRTHGAQRRFNIYDVPS